MFKNIFSRESGSNSSVRDVQPVGARRRTESFAKSASEMAVVTEPTIPGDFGNSKPIESLVAQQPLRPMEPAGIQFLAEGRACPGQQQMDVTARQTERGPDRRRVEVRFVAALAYRFRDTPQQCP